MKLTCGAFDARMPGRHCPGPHCPLGAWRKIARVSRLDGSRMGSDNCQPQSTDLPPASSGQASQQHRGTWAGSSPIPQPHHTMRNDRHRRLPTGQQLLTWPRSLLPELLNPHVIVMGLERPQ